MKRPRLGALPDKVSLCSTLRKWPKAIAALCVAILSPTIFLFLWLVSYIDLTIPSERCQIGSVTEREFKQLLDRAKAQSWVVWPGLSTGIFTPISPNASTNYSFELDASRELSGHIKNLILDEQSPDRQLAGAHAVLRAMHAEYVSRYLIAKSPGEAGPRIVFEYSIPTIRFAPFCFVCLIWWETTVSISFIHDNESKQYKNFNVRLTMSTFENKRNKDKSRNIQTGSCPKL